MSYETVADRADDDRVIRTICWAGLLALPVLTFLVHLLVIYRS